MALLRDGSSCLRGGSSYLISGSSCLRGGLEMALPVLEVALPVLEEDGNVDRYTIFPAVEMTDIGLLFVGCLKSQQHASVFQGRTCSDKFTCCH